MSNEPLTYKDAGVDIDAGNRMVDLIKPLVNRDPRVARLTVVELIPEVIEWHTDRTLPLGEAVAGDARCRLHEGDFFALSGIAGGYEEDRSPRTYDAVLVDIDHSTRHLIDAGSASFYQAPALAQLARQLKPGGVFALWSSDAEDAEFVEAMNASFVDVRAERVEFEHPGRPDPVFNIIYLGRRSSDQKIANRTIPIATR